MIISGRNWLKAQDCELLTARYMLDQELNDGNNIEFVYGLCDG